MSPIPCMSFQRITGEFKDINRAAKAKASLYNKRFKVFKTSSINQSYSFLSYLSLFMIALPLLLLLFPYRTSTGSKSFILYTFHKRFSSHCPLTDTVNVSSTLLQSFTVDFRFIFFFYFCFSLTYVTVIRFQLCCASPSFVPAATFSIKS